MAELEYCFKAPIRLNNDEIRDHLSRKFDGMMPGVLVLRIQQISGWVSSKVKKVKEGLKATKKAIIKAVNTTSNVAEHNTVGPKQNGKPPTAKPPAAKPPAAKPPAAKPPAAKAPAKAAKKRDDSDDEDDENESESVSDEEESEGSDDEEFEVEDILKHRWSKGGIEVQVRWKGYNNEWDTWEPLDVLRVSAETVVNKYCKKHPEIEQDVEAGAGSGTKKRDRSTQPPAPLFCLIGNNVQTNEDDACKPRWLGKGHEFVGKSVTRDFDDGVSGVQTCEGSITKYVLSADRGRQLEAVVFHIEYKPRLQRSEGNASGTATTWEAVNVDDAKAAIALHTRTGRNNRKRSRPAT